MCCGRSRDCLGSVFIVIRCSVLRGYAFEQRLGACWGMREHVAGILVTGGTGLLGLHWAQACKANYRVTVTTHVRPGNLAGVTHRAVDLSDASALDCTIAEGGVELLVHAAGLTSVERCEADPERAKYENTVVAIEVARAAERNGCRLIHVSTDHLFAGTEEVYTEDSVVTPLNVYGRTKAEAETGVLDACPTALVLRTNFYGWGPTYRPSFSDWILQRLAVGGPVPLFGDVRYTPTLIGPLIEGVMTLSAQGVSGVLNGAGDEALTKLEFGRRLAARFGYAEATIVASRRADQPGLVRRPASMALSNARLRHLLGRGLGSVDEQLEQLLSEAGTAQTLEIRRQ